MDKKNPMDPIIPPASDGSNPIFNNQTPSPHPEQGNAEAFSGQNKNFDDIAAKILEEAPPMSQVNEEQVPQPNQTMPSSPFNTPQDQTSAANQVNMPDSSVHVGGNLNKFLNWKIITIGIVGILLLTIGGVSAFKGDLYWIRDLVGMGIPSDPQKAIQKANSNTGKLESYKTKMDMKISGEMDETQFEVSTNLDISEKPKDKKAQIKLNSMQVNLPEELMGGTNVDDINSAVVGVEAISDNNTIYVKIPTVNDSWYQIDQSSVEGIQELNNFVPSVFSKETEKDQNPLTAAVVYAASSGEETSDIYKYLANIKRVKDEKIDGKSSYHYQADIDIAKAMGETGEVPAAYNELIDKYLKSKVDIWITKKEMVFAKMSLSLNVDMDLADFGANGNMKFDISVQMAMTDFGKDVAIDVPTDAKKFDEKVFEDLMSGKPVDVADSRNAQRKSDAKILQLALEAYYSANNSYPIAMSNSKSVDFMKELIDDKYLASAVKDPSHPNYYYSYTSSDGKSYTITYVEETNSGIKVQKITQ